MPIDTCDTIVRHYMYVEKDSFTWTGDKQVREEGEDKRKQGV